MECPLYYEFPNPSFRETKGSKIFGCLIVPLARGVAMPIIIFLAGLQSIPREITGSTRIDGATSKQVFWNIELPYLLQCLYGLYILPKKSGDCLFASLCHDRWGGKQCHNLTWGLLVYNYAFKNTIRCYECHCRVIVPLNCRVISIPIESI